MSRFHQLYKPSAVGFVLVLSSLGALGQTTTYTQTYSTPGSFTFPPASPPAPLNGGVTVTNVQVQLWGGGGAGGGINATDTRVTAGGGAGGNYEIETSVTISGSIPTSLSVGAGGQGVAGNNGQPGNPSTFSSPTPVSADGGNFGNMGLASGDRNGNGGAAKTTNDFQGGAGADGAGAASPSTNGASGGGGGGAGTTGDGTAAGSPAANNLGAGGTGSPAGGNGAAGIAVGSAGGNGAAGSSPGGGGSGGKSNAGSGERTGGAGGDGRIIVTYVLPDAPTALDLTNDTGPSSTDNITKETTITITGSSFNGHVITLYDGANTTPLTTSPAVITTSGTTWTADVTLADGDYSITARASLNGNTGLASSALAITIDATPPTAAVTYSPSSRVKDGDDVTITATFSEDVELTPAVEITIDGVAIDVTDDMTSNSATEWEYVINDLATSGANEVVTVTLGTATDLAGNTVTSTPTSGETFTIDNLEPVGTLSYDLNRKVKAGENLLVTASFGEDIKLSPDVFIQFTYPMPTGAQAPVQMTRNSATEYEYPHTVLAGDGTVTITFTAGTDLAGNLIETAANNDEFIVDNTPPTVVLTEAVPEADDYVRDDDGPITIIATFNEALDGTDPQIEIEDVEGPIAMTATGNPLVWEFEWTIPSNVSFDGTHNVVITANDEAGNALLVAGTTGSTSWIIDNTPPKALVDDDDAGDAIVRNGEDINFSVSFSDANPFTVTDPKITIDLVDEDMGGGPVNWSYLWLVPTGDDVYNLSFTDNGSTIVDIAGNELEAVAVGTGNVTWTVDNTAPTAAVTYDPSSSVKDGDNLTITATFDEDMSASPVVQIELTGLIAIGPVNMTVVPATDNRVWEYDVPTIATAGASGSVTVTLSNGTDVAGNPLDGTPASGATFSVDNEPLEVELTDTETNEYVRDADGTITIVATFSAALNATPPTIEIENVVGPVNMVQVSALVWEYDWDVPDNVSFDGAHDVLIVATNAAGTALLPAGISGRTSWFVDNSAPTATVDDDNAGDAIVKFGDPNVNFTVTFNDDPASSPLLFDDPQMFIGTATTSLDGADQGGDVFTYEWTIPSGNDGVHNMTFEQNGSPGFPIVDAAGNELVVQAGTGDISWTVDNIAPTATLTYDDADELVKAGDLLLVTATFDEDIEAGTDVYIEFTYPGGPQGPVQMTRNSATEYEYSHTVGSGDGTVTIEFTQGTDIAGNNINATPNNNDFEVDNTAPTATLAYDDADELVKAGDLLLVTATFDEDIEAGIDVYIEFTYPGGPQGPVQMTRNSATEYEYTHTVGSGDGTVTIAFTQGTDIALNPINATPNNNDFDIDNTSPTGTLAFDPDHAVKAGDFLTVTATFDEDIEAATDVYIEFTYPGGPQGSVLMTRNGPTEYEYTHTVGSGDGTVTIAFIQGTDLAGNTINATPNNNDFEVDNTAPTGTLAYDDADELVKAGDLLLVTATFDEDIEASVDVYIEFTYPGGPQGSVQMTRNSATEYEYTHTVGSGDGTVTIAFTAGTDIAGNDINTTPNNNDFDIDNIAPTATLNYDDADELVKAGDLLVVTATFDEDIEAGTDVYVEFTYPGGPQGPVQMTRNSATEYEYTHTVGTGDGTVTIAFTAGTDIAGNDINATPNNNDFDIDNTAPTATLAYDDTDELVKAGDLLLVTATFDEDIEAGTDVFIQFTYPGGPQTPVEMTRNSATEYEYTHTVGSGDGTVTIAVTQGTDIALNPINATPNNNDFDIDNTAPTGTLAYDDADELVKAGDLLLVTATFDEDIEAGTDVYIEFTYPGGPQGPVQMTRNSATEYEYSHTVGSGDGTVTIAFTQGTDIALNPINTTPNNNNFTVDNTAPTGTLAYDPNRRIKSGDNLEITAEFDEVIEASIDVQITITYPDASFTTETMTRLDPDTYVFNHTVGSGDGQVTITFAQGTDLAFNDINAAAVNDEFTVDNTSPTATLAYDDADELVKAGDLLVVTATFDEDIDAGTDVFVQFTYPGGPQTPVEMTRNSATEYEYTHTVGSGDGTVTIAFTQGTDIALNPINATPNNNDFDIDNTAPTATLAYDDADELVKAGDLLVVTATFDEDIEAGTDVFIQFTYPGGPQTPVEMTRNSATEYEYTHTVGSGDGTVTIAFTQGTDIALNPINATPNNNDFDIDNTAPTGTLAYDDADELVKAGDLLLVTATFDEDIEAGTDVYIEFTYPGGPQGPVQMTRNSATEYEYSHTVGTGDGTVTIAFTQGTDIALNPINATPNNNNFTVDNTAPTGTLTYDPDRRVKAGENLEITAQFDEPIEAGIDVEVTITYPDFSFVTETMTRLDADTYELNHTVGAGDGTVYVEFSQGTDLAFNDINETAVNDEFTVDNTNPTVTLTDAETDNYVRGVDADITITATFNEALDNTTPQIEIEDVVGPVNMVATGNPLVWEYTWNTPASAALDGEHLVIITANDEAGNALQQAGHSGRTSWISDNTAPTVELTDDDNADTDNNSVNGSVGAGETVLITATFTEDILLDPAINPTIQIVTADGAIDMDATVDPLVWTYTWDVPNTNDGTYTVIIAAKDKAGNNNTAATAGGTGTTQWTVDNVKPTGTLSYDDGDEKVKQGDALLITAEFSEPLDDDVDVKIDITYPDASVLTETLTRLDADTYEVTHTVGTGDGTATIAFTDGTDVAGNPIVVAGANNDYTVDNTDISSATITRNTGQNAIDYDVSATFKVVFSEAAYSFTAADISNAIAPGSGGATVSFNTLSTSDGGITWTFVASATTAGTIEPQIDISTIEDVVGNVAASQVFSNEQVEIAPLTPTSAGSISFTDINTTTVTVNQSGGNGANYLIVARAGATPVGFAPVDGTTYILDPDYSTAADQAGGGRILGLIPAGGSLAVTGLTLDTEYHFAAYAVNGSGSLANYYLTPATNSFTTPDDELTLTAGGTAETDFHTISVAGPGTYAFDFTVSDPGTDGYPARINKILIGEGSGDEFNWADVIEDARLSDGGNNQTTTAISSNELEFDGINTATLGFIADGGSKTYTLTIWVKTSLPEAVRTTIDGLNFAFEVQGGGFTVETTGSILGTVSPVSSGSAKNEVEIVASQLVFTKEPPATAVLDVALPVADQPRLEAQDAYGNLDLETIAATVTTETITHTGAPTQFTLGVMDFATAATFTYTSIGLSNMTVDAASPNIDVTSTVETFSTANTAVAQLSGGTASAPLQSLTTDHALLGFSLTTSGTVLDFTDLVVATNVTPIGKINTVRLMSSPSNTFSFATATELATGVMAASNITFSSITSSINSTASYYFVVANVERLIHNAAALQLTLTPTTTNVVVKSGGVQTGTVSGGGFSGTSYNFQDITPPTVVSITNEDALIYRENMVQRIAIRFDEEMATGTQPDPTQVSMDGGVTQWTATPVGWTTSGTYPNDVFLYDFTHTTADQEDATVFSHIADLSDATDLAGNNNTPGASSAASFDVDTKRPQATVTVNSSLVSVLTPTVEVTVTYSEVVQATPPTISFVALPGNTTLTNFISNADGAWSGGGTIWTETFTHNLTQEDFPTIVARVSDASNVLDLKGNSDLGDDSPTFILDTNMPEVDQILSTSHDEGYYNDLVTILGHVEFNEEIVVTNATDITVTLNSGGTATVTGGGAGTNYISWTYDILPGHNSTSLAATLITLNGATITDVNGNHVNLDVSLGDNIAASEGGDVVIDTTIPTVVSVSSPTTEGYFKEGTSISIEVEFSEPVDVYGTAPTLALNSGGTATYSSGSGTDTHTYIYTVGGGENSDDLDYVNTNDLVGDIQDYALNSVILTLPAAGGTGSLSDDQFYDIDTILPTMLSSVNTPGELNGIGSTEGTILTTVTYTVTFSEDVDDLDPSDFAFTATGDAGYPAYPLVTSIVPLGGVAPAAGFEDTYVITVDITNGTGTLRLDLDPAGSVVDRALNDNILAFTTGETYSIVQKEPTNNPTSPAAVSNHPRQTTVSWVNPSSGVLPTHYLITATGPAAGTETVPTAFVPTDGVPPAPEENFADGNGVLVVDLVNNPGTTSATFDNMRSGKPYTFKIYPYSLSPNNSSDNINYLTAGTVSASTTTITGSDGILTSDNTGVPLTISSLSENFGDVHFSFTIKDDGTSLTEADDDARMKISQIVIKANTGNTVTNWSQVIQEAELREVTQNPGVAILASGAAITANTITFDLSAHTGLNQSGYFEDDQLKKYELKIRLKTAFGGTAPQDVDGQRFEFLVSPAATSSFTFLANTSTIGASESAVSDHNSLDLNNRVNVIATQFDYTTQPPATIKVLKNVISTSAAPDNSTTPVVRARDIHGNTDKAYNATLTLTNADAISMSADGFPLLTTLAMSQGIAIVPSNFGYHDEGDGTLTVHSTVANELLASIPDESSSAIAVSYSANTAIGVSAEDEGLIISSLSAQTAGVLAFDFRITDQDAGPVDDGAPTRITDITITRAGAEVANWADAIDNAWLHNVEDNVDFYMTSITADEIVFAGIPHAAFGDHGYVPFGAETNYQLFIHLRTNLLGTYKDDIDNQHFHFKVDQADITLDPLSSTLAPAGTTHSDSDGGENNRVEVITTQLVFIIEPPTPPSDVLVNTDLASSPEVEAQDVLGNRDVDYNPTGSNVVITNGGGLDMRNEPTDFVGGLLDFPSDFQYTETLNGDGTLTVTTTLNAANGNPPSAAVSNTVLVRVAQGTTIAFVPAGTPATISSLADTAPGVTVFQFEVEDDGVALENDGSPTQITSITIVAGAGDQIPDWTDAIAGATLSDGTSTIPATSINASTLVFDLTTGDGPALGNVDNDVTETFTLNIWLRSDMPDILANSVDGLHFEFDVTSAANVVTDPTLSIFPAAETANSGSGNIVDVDATQLDFTTPAGVTSVSINTPLPAVVEARDENTNRDLDFDGAPSTITDLSNASTVFMFSTPDVEGSQFVDGVFEFPSDFQFTSGENDFDVTLSMTAGGISTLPVPAPFTPGITLSSSFASVFVLDPAFVPTPNIRYENFQDVSTVGSSLALTRFILFDGDGTNDDVDGAGTNIQDLTFSITNPANIRSLALYVGSTHIQTRNNADFTITGNSGTVTFAGLSSDILAQDDEQIVVTVRASFFNTEAAVEDNQQIQLQVTTATQNGGSKFNKFVANPIGGITGGAISDPNVRIEVMATSLDFVIQPDPFAGIDQPVVVEPEVHARDINGVIDLDVTGANGVATITTPPGIGELPSVEMVNAPTQFVLGKLFFPGFEYNSIGDGTISLAMLNGDGDDLQGTSSHVDVIHVNAILATVGVTNVDLGGGSTGKAIFGVTFRADYTVPNQPLLQRFNITFGTAGGIIGLFNNMKIFESADRAYSAGNEIDVEGDPNAVLTTLNSRSLLVEFPDGDGRDLHAAAGELTYFLVVDVAASANASTPPVQPKLEDGGFDSPGTDSVIVVSKGSAVAALLGNTFAFAAVNAPSILTSFPRPGQLDVDPTQGEVNMIFTAPVWTLDGKIQLHKKHPANAAEAVPVDLPRLNGMYPAGVDSEEDPDTKAAIIAATIAGTADRPLRFEIPSGTLQSDTEYYITIAPGNKLQLSGVIDAANNVSPGISFSETFSFKTASTQAPKLLRPPQVPKAPSVTNVSWTGATITGTFDRPGRAYYMLVPIGSPAPTNAQIKGDAVYVGSVHRGHFNVNQINPIAQFGLVNANLDPNSTYAVWMYAESYSTKSPSNPVDPADLLRGDSTAISTTAPFGGAVAGFAVGGAGPTLSFTTSATPFGAVKIFAPNISMCANSYQILNSPIVLVEGDIDDFDTDGQLKTFNLLLPSGYSFDISVVPNTTRPLYGTVTLFGGDLDTASLTYLNNSIVTIKYATKSSTPSTLDNIAITGLKIISASQSPSGKLTKLGGDALGAFPDGTIFGNVSTYDAAVITFTNSYSEFAYPDEDVPVAIIPDNFNAPSFTAQLIPIPPPGDYGASSFSGPGVTINQLNLSAVPINVPFNITITHTDNNGCISQNPVQYTVYDHNTAIGGVATEYCIVNPNAPNGQAPVGDPGNIKRIDKDNNVATGSRMVSLTATIPNAGGRLMRKNNADWLNLIENQLLETDGPPEDVFGDGQKFKQSYKYDVAKLMNTAFVNSYDSLKEFTTRGGTYWRSDTLGVIEFTARYVNSSNKQLVFPLKHNVEYWLPAIPLVEVVGALPDENNKTTFCQKGGIINIFGWPDAASGAFSGSFALYDGATRINTNNPGGAGYVAGFTDFSNGTASLDPDKLFNGYRPIRIEYTYKLAASPCESKGSLTILITPNPIAAYTSSLVACEGTPVEFDGVTSNFGTVTGFTINQWDWKFVDPNATAETGSNPNTGVGVKPTHTYEASALYRPELIVTSTYGCKSIAPFIADVRVGAVPVVDFTFGGVSTADDILVKNASTVPSNASLNDTFSRLTWTFDDGSSPLQVNNNFAVPAKHKYADPGHYDVKLEVRSTIGCVSDSTKEITVLHREIVADDDPYVEPFDSDDGKWQFASYDYTSLEPVEPSWRHDTANGPLNVNIKRDDDINVAKLWITSNTQGKYNGREKSAIYSPSLNMTDPELTRPMISLHTSRDLVQGDGVVLEFSVDTLNVADPNKKWTVLVKTDHNGEPTGDEWFNGQGLSSAPGGVQTTGFGWTGSSAADRGWKESKHILDALLAFDGKQGRPSRRNVVFRLALGSNSDNPLEGFAFDNVRIGNRTRTVLLENFKNLGNAALFNGSTTTQEKRVSDSLKTFSPGGPGTSVVKINYHVAFPNKDPFNLDNPQDPSARALYYGITTTPRTRLDGSTPDLNGLFTEWGVRRYNTQSLKLSYASIETDVDVQPGSITVDVQVRGIAKGAVIPAGAILHVAIVEGGQAGIGSDNLKNEMKNLIKTGEVSFEYVLKKMLPSAVGTKISTAIGHNQVYKLPVPLTWEPDLGKLYLPKDDLAVVVFLQNEQTREVYQTEVVLVNDPGVITGLEDGLRIEDITVYPVPAASELNVMLPRKAIGQVKLRLIDQLGKPVLADVIPDGENSATLGVEHLSSGVYILHVEENGRTTYRKVMVTH